jgi:catechol 2,3-dioxygenase-like lactoylglutathione lyase family enzyme
MADFERIAPIIPVRDLDAALARYRTLGFQTRAYTGPERYAFVDRDSISLHLTEWFDHDPLRTAASVYLYVSDVDTVYAEWTSAAPAGRMAPPRDTPWGLREFSYVDPDGTLHRVGSPVQNRQAG